SCLCFFALHENAWGRSSGASNASSSSRGRVPEAVRRRRPPKSWRAQKGTRGWSGAAEPTWTQHCWRRSTFRVQASMKCLTLPRLGEDDRVAHQAEQVAQLLPTEEARQGAIAAAPVDQEVGHGAAVGMAAGKGDEVVALHARLFRQAAKDTGGGDAAKRIDRD